MSIKMEKIGEREQLIIDILRGKPAINERVWERIKEKKLMSKQTYFNTRDKLILDKKIKKQKIGRSLRLFLPEDEELFIKITGLASKEGKMTHILIDRQIDEAVEILIEKLNRIPELYKIGVEMEKDPKNPEIRSLIFERLAKIKKVSEVINNILDYKYKGMPSVWVKKGKIEWLERTEYSIDKRLPSDDAIIEKVKKSIDISDIDISLIKELIQLGKKNLERKKVI